MSDRQYGLPEQLVIPLCFGVTRLCVALSLVVVLGYAGWCLLGMSGIGLMAPICQRMLGSAWPGRQYQLWLPKAELNGAHGGWSLDGHHLRQFWQMPWAICLCVTGARPQWLFRDEVSRGVFVQCCREAHLALSKASAPAVGS
jgi:hypothetical protein